MLPAHSTIKTIWILTFFLIAKYFTCESAKTLCVLFGPPSRNSMATTHYRNLHACILVLAWIRNFYNYWFSVSQIMRAISRSLSLSLAGHKLIRFHHLFWLLSTFPGTFQHAIYQWTSKYLLGARLSHSLSLLSQSPKCKRKTRLPFYIFRLPETNTVAKIKRHQIAAWVPFALG